MAKLVREPGPEPGAPAFRFSQLFPWPAAGRERKGREGVREGRREGGVDSRGSSRRRLQGNFQGDFLLGEWKVSGSGEE